MGGDFNAHKKGFNVFWMDRTKQYQLKKKKHSFEECCIFTRDIPGKPINVSWVPKEGYMSMILVQQQIY